MTEFADEAAYDSDLEDDWEAAMEKEEAEAAAAAAKAKAEEAEKAARAARKPRRNLNEEGEEEGDEMLPEARRAAAEMQQKALDAAAGADVFGGRSEDQSLAKANPKNEGDFKRFANDVAKQVRQQSGNSNYSSIFLPLVKALAMPLSIEQLQEVHTKVKDAVERKRRMEQEKKAVTQKAKKESSYSHKEQSTWNRNVAEMEGYTTAKSDGAGGEWRSDEPDFI